MTDNIRELPTPDKKREQSVIDLLKSSLKDAEAGEIESVMLVAFAPGRRFYNFVCSQDFTITERVGALMRMVHDLLAE
jgi:hypothetical protein